MEVVPLSVPTRSARTAPDHGQYRTHTQRSHFEYPQSRLARRHVGGGSALAIGITDAIARHDPFEMCWQSSEDKHGSLRLRPINLQLLSDRPYSTGIL
jgi:hypothetical protein